MPCNIMKYDTRLKKRKEMRKLYGKTYEMINFHENLHQQFIKCKVTE
jgi:hypothetical protein